MQVKQETESKGKLKHALYFISLHMDLGLFLRPSRMSFPYIFLQGSLLSLDLPCIYPYGIYPTLNDQFYFRLIRC